MEWNITTTIPNIGLLLFSLDMENDVTWWPYSNFSGNNSWYINNQTEPVSQIYLFTPAGVTAKRLLCSILSIIGGMGFLGNCFIFYFLWK